MRWTSAGHPENPHAAVAADLSDPASLERAFEGRTEPTASPSSAVGLQREGGELQLQNPRIFASAVHGFAEGLVGPLAALAVDVLARQELISLVVGV